jgi:hypothetical protein
VQVDRKTARFKTIDTSRLQVKIFEKTCEVTPTGLSITLPE